MQLRIQRMRKLGARHMSIKEMEAELEATRKKIGETKYLSFGMSALLVTEQKLEQALADAYTDAEMVVMIEDIAYAFLEHKGNLTNYWKTYNLNEREQRELKKYLEANTWAREDAYVEVDAPVKLQDLLTEYKD
jgi:hypothetical protein